MHNLITCHGMLWHAHPASPDLCAPCHPPPTTTQAEKALERIKEEGLIEKPFVAKKRSFTFPIVEKMGQKVRGCVESDQLCGACGWSVQTGRQAGQLARCNAWSSQPCAEARQCKADGQLGFCHTKAC